MQSANTVIPENPEKEIVEILWGLEKDNVTNPPTGVCDPEAMHPHRHPDLRPRPVDNDRGLSETQAVAQRPQPMH
jgi:hypothetical protein